VIRRRIVRSWPRGFSRAFCGGLTLVLPASCVGSGASDSQPSATVTTEPTTTRPTTSEVTGALPTPHSYEEACSLQPQVCFDATGTPPADLWRPMGVPPEAASCPATVGESPPPDPPFGRTVIGTSTPVSAAVGAVPGAPLVAAKGDLGWYTVKMIFFATEGYQGAVLVRGAGIGAAGQVAFGEVPNSSAILVPPGPGTNVRGGYRFWPGGLHVRGPGCFLVQVDGEDFSSQLIVSVQIDT